MTILESLKSISAYPVPDSTILDIATKHGLDTVAEADGNMQISRSYNLAKANLLVWVSYAPNVTQDGLSFDLSNNDREQMRAFAVRILRSFDGANVTKATVYGYKGDRL